MFALVLPLERVSWSIYLFGGIFQSINWLLMVHNEFINSMMGQGEERSKKVGVR